MSWTTVFASNSSTSPISGLNCASILRRWPNFFFAAETIAFSKALMRIVLSIPFSLLTCSITLFRSCCIFGTPVVLVIRLLDQCKRYFASHSVLIQGNLICGNLQQRPHKRSSALDQLAGANANVLTHKGQEMVRPLERTIDPWRGNLQRIGAVHDFVGVQKLAQVPAHPAQIVHVWTALLIQIQAQYATATASLVPELDVDNLHSLSFCQRRSELPNSGNGRIHACGPETKKAGKAHFKC